MENIPPIDTTKKKSSKLMILLLGVLFLLIVLVLLGFLYLYFFKDNAGEIEPQTQNKSNLLKNTIIITESQIENGITLDISKEEQLFADFGSEASYNGERDYSVTLNKITENSASICFSVEDNSNCHTLSLDNARKLDINDDAIEDCEIVLVSIGTKEIRMTIKKAEKDDTCAEKGGIICEGQNKLCTGNLIETIDTEKCCIGNCLKSTLENCEEQGGSICNSTQACNGHFINAKDSDYCCSGNCTNII
jgi:hypothetical protein